MTLKLLAKVPYNVIEAYKEVLSNMGCVSSDFEISQSIKSYTLTDLFVYSSNGPQRLRVDGAGNFIIGPGYAFIKLNITEEELTYLKLKVANVQYEVDDDNCI
jgi:hypothetical protein